MLNRRPPAAFLHGRTTRRVFTKGVVAALLTPVLASPLLHTPPSARAAALTTRLAPGEVPVHPQLINLTDGYGIFGRGWDDALWYRGYGQDEWQWVGGYLTSAPAATSWGNLQMSVFVRDSNDRLATIATTDGGDSWGPWVTLGAPSRRPRRSPPGPRAVWMSSLSLPTAAYNTRGTTMAGGGRAGKTWGEA